MRVLVAQARARANGGAEAYTRALIATLRAEGHEIGHVDIDGHQPPDATLTPLAYTIAGPTLWNWAWVCRALPRISLDYDRVILAFGEGPTLPVPTLTIRHAPAIFSHQDTLLEFLGAKPSSLRKGYASICRHIARIGSGSQSDITLANTTWTRTNAECLDDAQVDGVLYPPLVAPPASATLRRPFRLLCLGRLVRGKRIEDAIAILNQLRAAGLPAELEVCGRADSRYARSLVRRIGRHPHVILTLNASEGEKRRALGEASLGLHMYRGEHFGMAVAEMIDAGVVPIVFDDGGVTELVENPFLRFRDIGEAAKSAGVLLCRPDIRKDMQSELRTGQALRLARSFDLAARSCLTGFLTTPRLRDAG